MAVAPSCSGVPFSLHHRSPLYLINGNLTAIHYRDEILTRFAIPFLGQMGPQAVYQDDNARPHRAWVVDTYLRQAGVNRMNWPVCSPDHNSIEYVWEELDRQVRNNHIPPTEPVPDAAGRVAGTVPMVFYSPRQLHEESLQ